MKNIKKACPFKGTLGITGIICNCILQSKFRYSCNPCNHFAIIEILQSAMCSESPLVHGLCGRRIGFSILNFVTLTSDSHSASSKTPE